MTASLFTLGLNHQTAPLAVRERVVFHVERLHEALAELKRGLAREAAILSTCNRTELYVSADRPAELAQWLAEYHRLGQGELQQYLYTHPGEQAVRHAFRVAAGLDSMVLGEPQILGQMKEAARAAESAGTLGRLLRRLVRLLDLAEDLRLAEHHRVEARGDAVEVAQRRFGLLRGVHACAKTVQRRRQLLRRERKTAAQIQRRGRVVQAERDDTHRPIIKSRRFRAADPASGHF